MDSLFLYMEDRVFNEARFVKSITRLSQKPQPMLPEIAFAGRSNVGKSSLLNALSDNKRLAKTSSTPGKTQLINYFLIDRQHYFVDLPGYGYAKLNRAVKKQWQPMLENFLIHSKQLRLLVLLIDSRHTLQESDEQMIGWLQHENIPFMLVLTKADKLSQNELSKRESYFRRAFPDYHIFSISVKNKESIRHLSRFLKEQVMKKA